MEVVDTKRKKKRVLRGQLEVEHHGEGERERDTERERFKKLKGEEAAGGSDAGGGDPVAVPTEEEVEEFFAILRRMKVAVKYFDQKGKGGKEWREALEQTEVTVEDGENVKYDDDDDDDNDDDREAGAGAVKKNKGEEVAINEGLDLNAVAPEATEGGGV